MPEGVDLGDRPVRWQPRGYYGRPQLKPAPFNNHLVGSYVFLAGLSGAAALLATLLDVTRGPRATSAIRRGRYLSMLAPTVGAVFLIADLHTPKRFYNMMRVYKGTSPMSIGSWILLGSGLASSITAMAQLLSDKVWGLGWLRWIARVSQFPAALGGAGLATYTASLFSATSTPLWAAAPCALAVRFGAASMAAAAAAIGWGERRSRIGRDLDSIAVAALATELAATLAAETRYQALGVAPALRSTGGAVDQIGGTGVGAVLPLALHMVSLLVTRRRSRVLAGAASAAILAGSLAMRWGVMAAGDESAQRPDISLRFAGKE